MREPFAKHVLPNGLRVILVPRAESLTTTILVMAESGSKYEVKEKNGLAHFVEHMCFKGTLKRPTSSAISEEFDALGTNYNAFTAQEYTGYYASFAPSAFDRVLDLLADMYQHSQFPEAEINKERGVIIEEINMYEDLPMRNVEEILFSLIYGQTPVGRPISGTKKTVNNISRKDFLNYQQNNYRAASTILVVAGKFEEEGVLEKISQQFSDLPSGPKPEKLPVADKQSELGLELKFKKSDQTHLLFGLRGYAASDPRHYAAEVLAAVLGGGMSSRLFKKIRDDLGAAYYVRAGNDFFTDHGLLEIAVGADNKRAQEIVKVVAEELVRLRQDLVPESELARAKESLSGNLLLGLETTSGLANFYAEAEVLERQLLAPEILAEKLRQVSAEEVSAVAQDLIQNQRLNLALVGPAEDREPFVRVLKV